MYFLALEFSSTESVKKEFGFSHYKHSQSHTEVNFSHHCCAQQHLNHRKTLAEDIQEGRKVKKDRIHFSAAMTIIPLIKKLKLNTFPLLSKITVSIDCSSNTFLFS